MARDLTMPVPPTPADLGMAYQGEIHGPQFPLLPAQQAWMQMFSTLPEMRESLSRSSIPVLLKLTGNIDIDRLHGALNATAFQHLALRARFQATGGGICQHFHREAVEFSVRKVSLDQQTPQILEKLLFEDRCAPLETFGSQLFRASLFSLSNDRALLQITISHLIADARSTALVRRALITNYSRDLQAHDANDREARNYISYLLWRNSTKGSYFYDECLRLWKEYYAANSAAEALFADVRKSCSASLLERGSAAFHELKEFLLTPHLKKMLDKQSLVLRAPPSVLVLAALLITSFVQRHASRTRTCLTIITVVDDGRFSENIASLCGALAYPFPLVVSLAEESTAQEIISEVHGSLLRARRMPINLTDLMGSASLSCEVLADSLLLTSFFNQVSRAPTVETANDVEFSRVEIPRLIYAESPVMISVKQTAQGFALEWDWLIECFDQETITNLHRGVVEILEAILMNPQSRVTELNVFQGANCRATA